MNVTFGSKDPQPLKVGPGRSKMLVVQERSYANETDRQRALTQLSHRYPGNTAFTNGVDEEGHPRLFLSRHFSKTELEEAGYTVEEFYDDQFSQQASRRLG